MCVYCKEAPGCDHERDACAASRGEYCAQCGHGSAAIRLDVRRASHRINLISRPGGSR